MPRASIVISVFNAEKYIEQTLNSILNQKFSDFECVVVDDGSTDNTANIVKSYVDPRIKYFWQSNSGGPASPRNNGIKYALGEYVFIFDADDVMLPDKVGDSIAVLDNEPDVDFLFTNFSSIDEDSGIINENFLEPYDTFWKAINGIPPVGGWVRLDTDAAVHALLQVNYIGTSSVVLRRSALSSSDVFNEKLKNADDYLFWVTFILKHNAIYLHNVLHKYRVQFEGISNRDASRRAPSKIEVLSCLKAEYFNRGLKHIYQSKLANEYLGMAYSCKTRHLYQDQKEYACKSLGVKPSLAAFRLYIHATISVLKS